MKSTIRFVVCVLPWLCLADCTSNFPAGIDHSATGGVGGYGVLPIDGPGTTGGATTLVGTGGATTAGGTGGALIGHDAAVGDDVASTTDAGTDLAPALLPDAEATPDTAAPILLDAHPNPPLDTAPDLSLDLTSEAGPTPAAFASVVVAGIAPVCGLRTDGTIACWGAGAPATLPSGPFTSLTMGGWSCGVRANHSLVCWDSAGLVLGSAPGDGAPPAGNYTSASVGYVRACAVRVDGSVVCWGRWECTDQESPPSGAFVSVSSGESFACGVRSNGSVACWNQCSSGPIPTAPSGTFKSISVGHVLFACGVKSDGTLVCWGDNGSGQSTPPSGTFVSVSSGLGHACAVRTDGTLACWGDNAYGRATPPSGTFTSVDVTYDLSCAVRSDGVPVCWGDTSQGQATPPEG